MKKNTKSRTRRKVKFPATKKFAPKGGNSLNTKVAFLRPPKEKIPLIRVDRQAIKDIYFLVDECSVEIGWLGKVSKVGKEFFIQEIFLLEQEVDSTNTEISKEGQAQFLNDLLDDGDLEVVNQIRFWGHSHVRMSVGASWQDETKLLELAEDSDDFFVQGIFNKLGDVQFNILYIEENLIIENVPWALSGKQKFPDKDRREYWKNEIKAKVRVIKNPYYNKYSKNRNYYPGVIGWNNCPADDYFSDSVQTENQ